MITLPLYESLALFATMCLLAAFPGASVVLVAARSASSGFRHGVYTTLGIVCGDIVFILVSILGLAWLADVLGTAFLYVKYLGAVYLIWLGTGMIVRTGSQPGSEKFQAHSLSTSFLAGLMLTLSDIKAVMFYLALFPAFVDVSSMTSVDTLIIMTMAAMALGSTKLGYAWLAAQSQHRMNTRGGRFLQRVAGVVVIGVAVWMVMNA